LAHAEKLESLENQCRVDAAQASQGCRGPSIVVAIRWPAAAFQRNILWNSPGPDRRAEFD
jgi:hypothetical protein